MEKERKNKIIKISFIILNILLIIPTIIYYIKNKTVYGFNTYYNFFINPEFNKIISTIIYIVILIAIFTLYLVILKKKDLFKNLKQIILFVIIISVIIGIILPFTSSDVFYYMGVGELDGVYKQNPYYVTMREYYEANKENIDDEILIQGVNTFWSWTTVVYGPIAQLIFKICAVLSFKNVTLCLAIYKLVNLIVHIVNCYLIYKITGKKLFVALYGLNPFILLEAMANVHNDVIVIFFILLALYFLLKKKNLILCILFLSFATGMKYIALLILPFVILYHYRNEQNIGKRFLKCIIFGLLYLAFVGLAYLLYFRDFDILFAVLVQTDKYSKSICSVLMQHNETIAKIIKNIVMAIFVFTYITICIKTLFTKDIKFRKIIKDYNIGLILFLLALTNSQQWYLTWLFATIMWQKSKMIKDILGVSFISELANSVYMFDCEAPVYDLPYVIVLFGLSAIWIWFNHKKSNSFIGKGNKNKKIFSKLCKKENQQVYR